MKQRCNNLNSKDAHNYGLRGINVCDEWNDDFSAFKDWALSNGYDDTLSLDRINVNGNYEPANCRWATAKEQGRNTRSNHILRLNDQAKTMIEWSEETGIDYSTIARRTYNGWSDEKVLSEPVDYRKNSKKKEGKPNGVGV